MRIGLALKGANVTRENIAFAAQIGCTDLVVTPFGFDALPEGSRWHRRAPSMRYARSRPEEWSADRLSEIARQAGRWGLAFRTIENFNPADYCDIMLDGPDKAAQLDGLCRMMEQAAAAGVTHIGYGFNPTGVYGRRRCTDFRGGAAGLVFDGDSLPRVGGLPRGVVWNSVVDPDAPDGTIAPIGKEEIWARYWEMMDVLLPAAAACGVTLCLHPSDPPVETLCGTARLVCRLSDYDRIFRRSPQRENQMLFCTGTIQEMADTEDLTGALMRYGRAGRLGYIHLRSVSGKVPHYREEFPDQGEVDGPALLRGLIELGYDGVLVPDHTPEVTAAQPWQTGMAYAAGYWKGLLRALEGGGRQTSS